MSQGLRDEPGLQLDVLTHEAIHVVQDCLDGLDTPTSSTINLMLQAQGGFSPAQVDKFLLIISSRQRRIMYCMSPGLWGRCSAVAKLRPMSFRTKPAWSNPCWQGIADAGSGMSLWPHFVPKAMAIVLWSVGTIG